MIQINLIMKITVRLILFFTFCIQLITAQNVEWLVKPKYDVISDFNEGIAAVKLNAKWGYINEQGQEIVKPEYEVAYPFSEGAGVLGSSDKGIVGIADMQGQISIPNSSYKIDPRFAQFNDGLLLVTNGKKWGYLNKSGGIAINCKYISSQPFSEGLAGVLFDLDGGWYYIRTDGLTVIEPNPKKNIYWAMGFNNGKAIELYGKGMYCIDKTGKEVAISLPKLTPPGDPVYYKQKSLSCNEGELIFDSKCRAIELIGKNELRTELAYLPEKEPINKPQGKFELNGNILQFDDNSLIWNSSSEVTVKTVNGKFGIIKVKEKPKLKISVPADTLYSVFGNSTHLQIELLNSSALPANNLTLKINGRDIEKISFMAPNEKKKLFWSLSKNNDNEIEKESFKMSIYDEGLLLSNYSTDIIIKDLPSISVNFPDNHKKINSGQRGKLPVIVKNTANIKAENVIVSLGKQSFTISLNAGEEKSLNFDFDSSDRKVDIKVESQKATKSKDLFTFW